MTPPPPATTVATAVQPVASSSHPVVELMARYKAIFSAAWQHRAELAGPKRLADEAAFLPAALRLQDTPVHPAPRRFAIAIMALFLIAVAWACLGKVDIVAVAPGRIIVGDRTKLIQPLEASIVRKVLVKDGDRVQGGQVLVELDPTIASADKAGVQEQIKTAASEVFRTQSLQSLLLNELSNTKQTNATPRDLRLDFSLKTLDFTKTPSIIPNIGTIVCPTIDHQSERSTQTQLNSEWQDIRAKLAKLAKLDAEAARRQAEVATVQASISKLQSTIPMAQTREADYKNLVGEGFISSHATQDKTGERVELERDLATQRARLQEAQSALTETEHAKAAYRAETLRQLNDRHALASSKLEQLSAEHHKASQRERQTRLSAPVAGVIQQLAIHSVGGVVPSAQPLMIMVPDSATVTACCRRPKSDPLQAIVPIQN